MNLPSEGEGISMKYWLESHRGRCLGITVVGLRHCLQHDYYTETTILYFNTNNKCTWFVRMPVVHEILDINRNPHGFLFIP